MQTSRRSRGADKKKRAKAVRHMNVREMVETYSPFDDLLKGVIRREDSVIHRQKAYAMIISKDIMDGRNYSKFSRDHIETKHELKVKKVSDKLLKEFILESFETPITKVQRGDKEFLSNFMLKRRISGFEDIGGLCVGEVLWYLSTILSLRVGGPIRYWWELFYRNCDITRYGKHSYNDLMNRIAVNELITGYGFGIFGLRRDGSMVHIPGFEKQLTIYFTIIEANYQQKCRKV